MDRRLTTPKLAATFLILAAAAISPVTSSFAEDTSDVKDVSEMTWEDYRDMFGDVMEGNTEGITVEDKTNE